LLKRLFFSKPQALLFKHQKRFILDLDSNSDGERNIYDKNSSTLNGFMTPMKKLGEMETLNNDLLTVLNKRGKTKIDKTLLRGILEKDVEQLDEGS